MGRVGIRGVPVMKVDGQDVRLNNLFALDATTAESVSSDLASNLAQQESDYLVNQRAVRGGRGGRGGNSFGGRGRGRRGRGRGGGQPYGMQRAGVGGYGGADGVGGIGGVGGGFGGVGGFKGGGVNTRTCLAPSPPKAPPKRINKEKQRTFSEPTPGIRDQTVEENIK
eukprot:TRINITY_DN13505_c0_g1_i1.p1 TRINITY_DN13505_c0_g1~~TRINITY_DN13505_c0_g1_i1.p1  ORF type:complete len:168 (+),score=3.26 TRINITY_DN13505_c0_g1_i1:210-713(+)